MAASGKGSRRKRGARAPADTLELAMTLDPMNPETWRAWADAEARRGNANKAAALKEIATWL